MILFYRLVDRKGNDSPLEKIYKEKVDTIPGVVLVKLGTKSRSLESPLSTTQTAVMYRSIVNHSPSNQFFHKLIELYI